MRVPLALATALLLAAPFGSGQVAPPSAVPYSVCVIEDADEGCPASKLATGHAAFPEGAPRGLVVIAHGYGHTSTSHLAHLSRIAEDGYVAVAMDFRGTGFPLRAGADDTIAATRDLLASHPTDLVVLYSVSMGTTVAGMVLAEMPDVFDYWVDNEGLAMLHETWAGATALAPSGNAFAVQAAADIEAECGGTPVDAPACYLERSAATRASEFVGLKGAILTHGLNDGLVPYDQGREMAAALRATGVPVEFHTVTTSAPGGEGTTVTGYTPAGGMGLAGHGTESNDAHALTALSFALLHEILGGRAPADGESVRAEALPSLP